MHSPLKNRKYLVTGASGYVGGRLVKALVEDSSDVRILVRDRHKVQGQPWASDVEICEGSAENRADMMQKFAKLSGLKKRWIIKVPVLTPGLSKITDHGVETRWSDATIPTAPWLKAQGDPEWAGETVLRDRRETLTDIAIEKVWKQIEGIGGEHGWFGSDFLWWGRGLVDRLVGGVGLRRGRRDPDFLRVGESLDFWRVEELDRGHHLKLYAEMVLPGKAWLEFTVTTASGKTRIVQEATFNPRGLGGQLYWYALSPFHLFVFPTMLRNIIKKAASDA